jgi:hypothetical protein
VNVYMISLRRLLKDCCFHVRVQKCEWSKHSLSVSASHWPPCLVTENVLPLGEEQKCSTTRVCDGMGTSSLKYFVLVRAEAVKLVIL